MPRFRKRYRKRSYKGLYKTMKKIARSEVKKVTPDDYKVYDHAVSETPTSAGIVEYVSDIAVGTDGDERNGQCIKVKSIRFRGSIAIDPSATFTWFRMMIFKDRDANRGANVQVTDVLTSASVNALPFVDNRDRFKIYYDKTWRLNDSEGEGFHFDFYKKFKYGLNVKYDAIFGGITVADAQENALYVLVISNEPTNDPTISGTFRITYVDN